MAAFNPILLAIAVILAIVAIMIFIYVFFIKQNNVGGQTVVTCSAPPNPPTGVTAFIASNNSITTQWDSTPNADTYRGYIGTTNNFPTSKALIITSTGTTSTTFSNLAGGFTYFIKITAFNTCGESVTSNQVSIFLPYTPPSNFIIRNHNDNNVQLSMDPANVNPYRNFFTQNCNATNCHYQFNPIDNTILLTSDNTRCLTVVTGTQLWTNPCNSSSLNQRQWKYDPTDNTLCLQSDLQNSCLRLPPGFTDPGGFGQYAVIGSKTENAISSWDLVQV